MIAIIDYGMGNIHSVKKALELMGARTLVTNNPEDIKKADKAVLPGVGAFGDAMAELKKQGLIPALKSHIKQQKIFLGICLGMQLLFESSQESPKVEGLKVLKGSVKKFIPRKDLKVPHMGWNQLKKVTGCGSQVSGECPLLKGIADNAFVYFCHSYYPAPRDRQVAAAVTDYADGFPSVVWQDNVYGVQFHPEKSQDIGLRMLKNFIELC
jgi:imidazole glycerol-phosphate synthase subunit HisH